MKESGDIQTELKWRKSIEFKKKTRLRVAKYGSTVKAMLKKQQMNLKESCTKSDRIVYSTKISIIQYSISQPISLRTHKIRN